MFNIIILKGNITDETANTRICTTVSEGDPQTICQNLDNLNPENNSNVIESKVFTFDNVPVNASFHSCIQRLIYPNVTLCGNYGSTNDQGRTVEQIMLPFFGVDPAEAEDDEGYTACPTYLTEVQCYGKIVKTPDDGYDVNDTSIDQVSNQIALTMQQLPVGNTKPNQTYSLTELSAEYYKGLDWWAICNNSLVRSYISKPCETLVTSDHHALTSQGKIVLESILCPKGPSILSTIELLHGPIPDKAKNELSNACAFGC
jgi:hypothetical protein